MNGNHLTRALIKPVELFYYYHSLLKTSPGNASVSQPELHTRPVRKACAKVQLSLSSSWKNDSAPPYQRMMLN